MAKRLMSNLILSSKTPKCNSLIMRVTCKMMHTSIPNKEIKIPTEFGHIAGKLWGSSDKRPILALHGWQDNAGTWDPLVPLILKERSILAIDFPGHGLSSWMPPGMVYYAWDFPRNILYIKDYFKWDKVSLLCHSMGAIAAMRFTCLFPDDVDFYIAIDSLIHDDYDLNMVMDKYPTILRKVSRAQKRLNEEPPAYTQEEIKQKWHLGTHKSVSLESVQYLAKRGTKPSSHDPNKYYFSRDERLKYSLFNPDGKTFIETLIKRLKCPTLYVKAIDSPFSADKFAVEMRSIIEKNNDKFEMHLVPGKHHVHLNEPEKVAPLIINFLNKYNMSI